MTVTAKESEPTLPARSRARRVISYLPAAVNFRLAVRPTAPVAQPAQNDQAKLGSSSPLPMSVADFVLNATVSPVSTVRSSAVAQRSGSDVSRPIVSLTSVELPAGSTTRAQTVLVPSPGGRVKVGLGE